MTQQRNDKLLSFLLSFFSDAVVNFSVCKKRSKKYKKGIDQMRV